MSDDTLTWVIPAITLGYHVCQDPCGRFRFYTEDVEVVYREGNWIGRDGLDKDRVYDDLPSALKGEA